MLCAFFALGRVLSRTQEVCAHDRDAFLFVVLPATNPCLDRAMTVTQGQSCRSDISWMFPHVLKSYDSRTVFKMLAYVEHVSVSIVSPN